MCKELIKFWEEAKLSDPPFVHPQDEKAIYDRRLSHTPVKTFDEYEAAFREGRLEAKKLHLTLLPQPYHGDIENARLVILLLNPGLHANDFYLESRHTEFRRELQATIRQTRKSHVFLDPKWAWTTGFTWWETKLRAVAREIADSRYHGRYGCALELLSREVACLEMVPYHSVSFGAKTNLASAIAAKKAADMIACDKDRTVIVTRQIKEWNLSNQGNVIKYVGGEARGASLGPNSKGGKAILKAALLHNSDRGGFTS